MKRKNIYGLVAGIGILAGIGSCGYFGYKMSVKKEFTKRDLVIEVAGLAICTGCFTYGGIEALKHLSKDKQNKLEKDLQK